MFYFFILFLSLLHLIGLYRRYETRKETVSENDKALMLISAAVALSLPFLGLIRVSWIVTAVILAAVAAGYYFREQLVPKAEPHFGRLYRYYRDGMPLPCVVLSIAGLFCWAWYW